MEELYDICDVVDRVVLDIYYIFGCIFPFTDLVTRLSNSNMAPPSRFATVSEFLLGLRDSASTGSSAIDISCIQNISECKNKTKGTHEGQSRWCKSSIQAMSNETPTIVFGNAQSLRMKVDELYTNIKHNCALWMDTSC